MADDVESFLANFLGPLPKSINSLYLFWSFDISLRDWNLYIASKLDQIVSLALYAIQYFGIY